MPSRSKAQQRLFGMALAVRRGELNRSQVSDEVLKLVDSKITNKQLEDFARTKHKGLPNHVRKHKKRKKLESLASFLNNAMNLSINIYENNSNNESMSENNNYKSLTNFLNESLSVETKYANGKEYKLNTFMPPNQAVCFIVIKPGFLNLSYTIIKMFQEQNFKLKKQCTKRLSLEEAKQLYKVHKKEKFYNDLCKYMSSDASTAIVFELPMVDENTAIEQCLKLKDKIREKYKESDMRNVLHSSDNIKNLKEEAAIYFNEI